MTKIRQSKPTTPPVKQTQGWEKSLENTRLWKEGGSSFECSDYEGICEDMKHFISKTRSSQKQEIVEKIERAERNAINEGIKKFGVYKYDYMEGVFMMKFSLLDILSALEKEKK